MITIYKTNSMHDGAEYIGSVLQRVDKTNLSSMHTVIVPDRASMEAERLLLKQVGGSFNVQVKTFRRLANDILPKYSYLSKQSGIMALSGIIQDNKQRLTCYTKGINTPGFVESVYDTISMMKYCKISPKQLFGADLPRSVCGKAQDIALLYQEYLNFTENRFVDSADKLDLLCENLCSSKVVTDGYFYLYDFDNFSAQELLLVEQLMLQSKGVTVACCVGQNTDGHLYLNDIYNGVINVCQRNGITPNVISNCGYVNKYTQQIGQNLYRYTTPCPIANGNFCEVFQGETRVDEVYSLACKVAKYVRDGGRYSDIYVVTSDINKYTNTISTVFKQFEIPYFCDKQYVLTNHPYARYILDYLSVCQNNGKIDYVLPFVKNYLFCGVFDGKTSQDDDVFQFENFCLKYNVSYRYDKFTLGLNDAMFTKADSFRTKFNNVYKTNVIPQQSTVAEYVSLVRQLIINNNLSDKNNAFAVEQQTNGYGYQARVTEQVEEKTEQVLVQAELVLGNRVVKLDEFVSTLNAGFDAVKINVIPITNDCVVFANMAKARKHDIKFLALLGANYGAMPIVKGDSNLLTDRNIADLVCAGINVEPMIYTENKRERFSLFQLLQEPTDKLYVSYTVTEGANSLAPSTFVYDLLGLFTENGKPLNINFGIDEDVYTYSQAISRVVLNNRRLQDCQKVNMPAYSLLHNEFGNVTDKYTYNTDWRNLYVDNGQKLYLKNATTSVSQLTDFFKCPYKFFIRYGLNVKPRDVAQLKSADLGNILHAVLENYVKVMDINETKEQTNEKAQHCYELAMSDDFYKGMKNDPQMQGILRQINSESLRMCNVVKQQVAESQFVNLDTELEFGENAPVNPVEVKFNGGKFLLKGKIDRVDVKDNHFIVIDYKSGAEASKYTEEYLYLGHKMQLLVYVKAVQDYYKKQPAGFYYFNMHDDFADVNEDNSYFYNGRTLNDVAVATQIDVNLKNGVSKKLGLKLIKDGTFGKSKKALSQQQIANQIDYAFNLIGDAGKLMQKGYAGVNPYEHSCEFCDYKDICDFNDACTYSVRKLTQNVTSQAIDNIITKQK